MSRKILVVGNGAREHALVWALTKNSGNEVHCAPGNGGICEVAVCHREVKANYFPAILALCKKLGVDLVVVGPEEPLVNGVTDFLSANGVAVFGPTKAAARLEGSKVSAKQFMERSLIPTPEWCYFRSFRRAAAYIRGHKGQLVVKADGLCGGKGVTVEKEIGDKKKSKEALVAAAKELMVGKRFGAAGESIVVEEKLVGKECSFVVQTDGTNVMPLKPATDYKRRYDGDDGPNTGGMGCYAPVPRFTPDIEEEVMERIVMPTIRGMAAEGNTYRGFLYFGLMLTRKGPFVLEYNVRPGDPETSVQLPLLKSDLSELLFAGVNGGLAGVKAELSDEAAVCVVVVTENYPDKGGSSGEHITGIDYAKECGALVFHAGTAKTPLGSTVTAGGRIFNVVGVGDNFSDARDVAYRGTMKIKFGTSDYRRDIALEPAFSPPWGTR